MRTYGRFTTSIYQDEDFRALTVEQQGIYFMLGLQPEVSAAGTLPLTVRRWSKNAAGASPELIREVLKLLEHLGHVLVDEDTEELLIVKFVKWDLGYKNEKRRPVIRDAARGLQSPFLRRALADELDELGLSDMASELRPDTASDTTSDTATPFDRTVVNEGEWEQTTVHSPQTADRNPSEASDEPAGKPPRRDLNDHFAEFWQTYPRKAGKPPAQRAFDRAVKRAAPEAIIAAARRYRDDPNREPQFTAFPATWLNRDGWEDPPLPSRQASRPVSVGSAALVPAIRTWTPPEDAL